MKVVVKVEKQSSQPFDFMLPVPIRLPDRPIHYQKKNKLIYTIMSWTIIILLYMIYSFIIKCKAQRLLKSYESEIVKTVFDKALQKSIERQVAQLVELQTLEAEVWESKPVLGTWWWDPIPPNQPYPKVTAPAATTHHRVVTLNSPERG